MKFLTSVIAAVIGATFIGVNPLGAQANENNGYNSVPNGYGPVIRDYTPSTNYPNYQFPSNYQPGLQRNIRYAPGSCSSYVNC